MKAVVQRVLRATVTVDGAVVGEIGRGLLVFLGAAPGDNTQTADALATRIAQARVFADEKGRMNRSLADVGGRMLVVSQFTLLGDTIFALSSNEWGRNAQLLEGVERVARGISALVDVQDRS